MSRPSAATGALQRVSLHTLRDWDSPLLNLTASVTSKRPHTSVRRDGMNGHVGVNEQGDTNPDFANTLAKATGTSTPLTHNASAKKSASKAKSAKATIVDLNMTMKSDKKLRYDSAEYEGIIDKKCPGCTAIF